MQRRWRASLMFCVIIASLMASSEIAFGSCIKFPRDAEQPTVEVCEHSDAYAFRIGNHTQSFLKNEFSLKISEAARIWLSSHGKLTSLPKSTTIQIWMTVPMANPEAAQPRALVQTANGWVSFWFDLNKLEWEFDDTESAILGKDSYPQTYGHRPATVFVQSLPGTNPELVESALRAKGATAILDRGNGSFEARCGIFDEKKLATQIASMKDLVKHAQVNSVMEWIADRQMAFSFLADDNR